MKVCIFTAVHRWDDVRIFHKQAKSLAKYFEVDLYAPAEFKICEIDGVKIHGLPLWKRVKDRKIIRKELFRMMRKSEADVFHFHDPELLLIGLYLKIFRGKRVIYDVHENVGETIKTKYWLSKIIRLGVFCVYKILEKLAVLLFDKLILAENSYRQFIRKNFIEVLNFPIVETLEVPIKKSMDIVYLGGITMNRGVFQVLESLVILKQNGMTIRVDFIGPIFDNLEEKIKTFIGQHDLIDTVRFLGRKPQNEALEIAETAKLGLCLLLPHKNYLETQPTKIFEYFMLELPVLASNFEKWEKMILPNDCGKTCNPENPKEIADAISEMLKYPEKLKIMGKNGRKLVEERYNWKTEEKKILHLYWSMNK